jgi:flagellar biosynthesis protein FliR
MIISSVAIYTFARVMTRVSGLMLMAPVYSSSALNMKLKLGLLVILSYIIGSTLPAGIREVPSTPIIVLGLCSELMAGMLIGFGYRMAMTAAATGGEAIGLQMGLGAASLIDYNSGQNAALASNLFAVIFTVLFISMDGHHTILLVLRESFALLPVRETVYNLPPPTEIASNAAYAMSAGCRIAAPVLIPLMMLTLTMGLISRVFPQANIYSMSYGISMLVGMVLLGLSMPLLRAAIHEMVKHADYSTVRILRSLAGA